MQIEIFKQTKVRAASTGSILSRTPEQLVKRVSRRREEIFGGEMKIPEVANRIREISAQIQTDYPAEAIELGQLADELRRRSPTAPRAPATSTPMTLELADEIREFAEANPGTSHQDIAVVFNVNHGRISEVLSGKRQ